MADHSARAHGRDGGGWRRGEAGLRCDDDDEEDRRRHHRGRAAGLTPKARSESRDMALKRMDNVLIVVEDLEAVKAFFIELGLELEGESMVEGPLVGSLIGLKAVRATLAMLRTPDGHGGIELDKFHTPNAIRYGPVKAPANA